MPPNSPKHLRLIPLLLTLSVIPSCGPSKDTADCETLELIARGVSNYKDTFKNFPPPVVLDEEGKPLHSWRVLIVPQLEQNTFYAGYDFDVAWNDSPNADLADGTRRLPGPKVPDPASVRDLYQPHLTKRSSSDFTTDFLMVVRGDEPLEPFKGLPTKHPGGRNWQAPASADPDECIIVQLKKSNVHWMEPKDIVLTSPAPAWGVPLDSGQADILGSVLVSGGKVTCNDREATLKLLADRKSRLKPQAAGSLPKEGKSP